MNEKYTLDNIKNLNMIIKIFNAICFLSGIILIVFQLYGNIPPHIILLLGLLLFLSITQTKYNKFHYFKDTDNEVKIFYAIIIVSDMFYVGMFFFQIGRLFIKTFLG